MSLIRLREISRLYQMGGETIYALRTVILPFVWIFNPQLLIIDVRGWWELFLVVTSATVACLIFAAATMNYFQTRSRWWDGSRSGNGSSWPPGAHHTRSGH